MISVSEFDLVDTSGESNVKNSQSSKCFLNNSLNIFSTWNTFQNILAFVCDIYKTFLHFYNFKIVLNVS